MRPSLTVRLFFWGGDIALPRLWPFHDLLAARADIDYHLHLVGRYTGPDRSEVTARPWVTGTIIRPRLRRPEVWIIRGWNRPQLLWRARTARLLGVPLVMWHESPGKTWEAATLAQAARIRARTLLMPRLFRPFRGGTVLLGTGPQATAAFRSLAPGSPVHHFPYPDPVADELLALPPAPARGDDGPPRVLYLGTFSRTKGVDVLAAACDRLWSDGRVFEVAWVGDGPDRRLVEEHASRSGGRARVHSFASGAELIDHVRSAQLLVLPSRRDGWGLVVHEALAAGVPVVCTDACGSAMLVTDSGAGTVVAADDVSGLADGIDAVLRQARDDREGELATRARSLAASMTMPLLADELVTRCHEATELVLLGSTSAARKATRTTR